jgi:hypothetical protein
LGAVDAAAAGFFAAGFCALAGIASAQRADMASTADSVRSAREPIA